ncbi:hypothetical protein [Cetobacterium sp.]|uniref:hypothetical protein n=1 Tax=Cetobacterium sp. TaxID=2071632 RepID=UPI003F2E9A58
MSIQLLKLIKKNIKTFIWSFFISLSITTYLYFTNPIIYSAKGIFKYIEPEGQSKVTKIDTNGTITYESFTPGDGGLHIPSLIKSDSLNISLNTGNGIYTITSKSFDSNYPITEVNNFLNELFEININFLNNKLKSIEEDEKKLKFQNLIKNPSKSFPLLIKADKIETIDNRYLIIFYGFIISFFISLTTVVIKERVDEI